MAIPFQLRADVAALAYAVTAAAPLSKATRILVNTLQRQGAQVFTDIDAALEEAAGDLDGNDEANADQIVPLADFQTGDFSPLDFSMVYQPVPLPRLVDGDPIGNPSEFEGFLLGLSAASEDQAALCDMRGLVGRAMFNLAQAGV